MRRPLILFALGALGGLVGDMGHVVSGTTRYLHDGVPFVWESALWFPLMVGTGTAALGEIRARLGPARPGTLTDGVACVAAILGFYALTAAVRDVPLGPATVLCWSVAVLIVCWLSDGRPALTCAVLAAFNGTLIEIILADRGVFEYADDIDTFFGVPPWLPALYVAFGVVVARLSELLTSSDGASTA